MLFVPPFPAHRFAPVGVACGVYLGLVLGVSYGPWVLGVPDLLVGPEALVLAVVLLGPFLSASRRLAPDPSEVE